MRKPESSKDIFLKILLGMVLIVAIFLVYRCLSGLAVNEAISGKSQSPIESDKSHMIVLAYHNVIDEASDGNGLPLIDFEKQMKWLADNGYHAIGLADLLAYHEKRYFPEKTVMITFDDGYQSFCELAYPVLKKYNFKAVIFPVVGMTPGLETDMVWYKHLSFHELRQMDKDSGLIDIGSHTYNLHYYREDDQAAITAKKDESGKDYYDRIKQDLRISKDLLEMQTGQKIIALAWPYGITNQISVGIAGDLGFCALFIIKPGLVTPETPLSRIPRYAVTTGSLEDFTHIMAYNN